MEPMIVTSDKYLPDIKYLETGEGYIIKSDDQVTFGTVMGCCGCSMFFLSIFGSVLVINLEMIGAIITGVVGLVVLYGIYHTYVQYRNFGEGRVIFTDYPMRLGDRGIKFTVHQVVKTRKPVSEIEVHLVCEEHVKYTVGTDTKTEIHPIVNERKQPINKLIEARNALTTYEVLIPAGAPASFEGKNNQIKWSIKATHKLSNGLEFTANYYFLVLNEGVDLND